MPKAKRKAKKKAVIDDSLKNNIYTGDIIIPDKIKKKRHIGNLNESGLHNAIKHYYQRSGDRVEVKTGRYYIDIVRDDELIEIQTSNFTSIRNKLKSLLNEYKVRLVYPIPEKKYIVRVSPDTGEIISRRKSPKHGKITDLFNELLRIPGMINHENFVFEVILCNVEEYRCKDGNGSWRRQGDSIIERKLIDVIETVEFKDKYDFMTFLIDTKDNPFTTKKLAKKKNVSVGLARKIAYTLYGMGLIERVGKEGNSYLYLLAK